MNTILCAPQAHLDDDFRRAVVPSLDHWLIAWARVIRARRTELDITQEELGRRLRTSRPTVARLESTTRSHLPRWDTVVSLAVALELGVAELVSRVEVEAVEVEGSGAG